MNRNETTLYLVVPCYNEEEVLPSTHELMLDKLLRMEKSGLISGKSRIVFVDDGSKDGTWNLIERYHEKDAHFIGLKLAHNRGHQNAVLAGLLWAKERCDAVISLDCDAQDDIEVLDEFVRKYQDGAEIVYGVRKDRKTDTAFKRGSAQAFYRVLRSMGAETVYNHADYRLMSRTALFALAEYGEVNLYLRGMVPDLGFRTDIVYYDRHERLAGESKYPLKKMLSLAGQGITSFSNKPLSLLLNLSLILGGLSLLLLLYALLAAVFSWAGALVTALLGAYFLGTALVIFAVSIVGAYVGKIYLEVKHRPRYHLEKVLSEETAEENDHA